MALDAANFLLQLHRDSASSRQLELRVPPPLHSSSDTPSAAPCYTYERAASRAYGAQLLDGHARVLLAEWQSAGKKQGVLGLRQPDGEVKVTKEKGWACEWRWEWEGETYQWKRETNALGMSGGKAGFACDIVRKPDPSVAVARYKPALKARPAQLEVLDYNLLRIDIADRKGLEITLICVLLALLDGEGEDALGDSAEEGSTAASPAATDANKVLAAPASAPTQAAAKLASNEVEITPYGEEAAYIKHCLSLLRCDAEGNAMDLIILQAHSADAARRAVGIAAGVKGAYYRLPQAAKGSSADSTVEGAGELFQYVREPGRSSAASSAETPAQSIAAEARARPRIQLNAPATGSSTPPQQPEPKRPTSMQYAPPERLSIYLSKLRIAELERVQPPPPRTAPPVRAAPPPALAPSPGPRPRPRSQGPSPTPPSPPEPAKEQKEPRGVGKLLGKLGRKHADEH